MMLSCALELIFQFFGTFVVQLLIGEFLLCFTLRHRKQFIYRLIVFIPFCAVPFIYGVMSQQNFYQLPIFSIGWFSYSFVLLALISSGLLLFCFDTPYTQILFYVAAAHVIQNLIYTIRCIWEQIFFPTDRGTIYQLSSLVLYLLLWYLAYRVLVQSIISDRIDIDNHSLLIFAVLATMIVNILNYWTYMFGYSTLATMVYEAICCLLLLIIQFGIFDRSKRKQEYEVMTRVHSTLARQHQMSKESIDTINRKCHDLKHQVSMLRNMKNHDCLEDSLQEIEQAITIYDLSAKTGNDALDTLLTEKSLLCEKYKINLTYITDGGKLDFISLTDLYSLFGNALDNAIECVCKEDESDRIISLNISEKHGIISILMDNYCSVPLSFNNGVPLSTKPNDGYHGFGLNSMKYIVEKYGGHLTIKQDLAANRFILSILFPPRS